MLYNHFKIAWRNITLNKFYTGLNILGLAFGLTACLLLYSYITFHWGFDRFHGQADRTYRLVNELHLEKTEYSKGASFAMAEALKNEIPEIDRSALLMSDQDFSLKVGDAYFKTEKKAALTNSDWFELFDFKWLQGNPEDLDQPDALALTAGVAASYFGDEDPMGKRILIDDIHPFRVVGVIDDSQTNTSLRHDVYVSINAVHTLYPNIFADYFTSWGFITSSNNVFVSLHDPSQRAAVEQKLKQLAAQNLDPSVVDAYTFKLLPLTELHFDLRYGGTVKKSLLLTLAIIGICISVVAAINYVNLSLAQQARRNIEIGTRKVLGCSSRQLFGQFLVESGITVFLALLVSVGLTFATLPLINHHLMASEPILLPSWLPLAGFTLLLWITVSLLSGIYPAWLLARLNVLHTLKGQVPLGRQGGRKPLLLTQNVVAQVLLMVTVIFILQVKYLKNTDFGFDREAVVMLPLPKSYESTLQRFLNGFASDPRIQAYSHCLQAPAGKQRWGGTVLFDEREEWEEWPARYVFSDQGYLKTFGIALAAGRNVRESPSIPEYLINQTMVVRLGYDKPDDVLGKMLHAGGLNDQEPGMIVGVVNDFNTHSLFYSIEPVVIGAKYDQQRMLAVKIDLRASSAVLSTIQRNWQKVYPNEPFTYSFLDDDIKSLYEKETTLQTLIWLAAVVAIIISSLGLLGMVMLTVLARTKEIGIRKVLGASANQVVRLLSIDFVKLVGLSFLVACPIAWWAMNKWLQDFAYRIDIQWWMFSVAGLAAVVIALVTVSWQAIRAATANPVESLRDE